MKPKAVILSGGPASVPDAGSPRAPQAIFASGVPVLGICYGQMTMAEQLGGEVESGHHREFGRAEVTVGATSPLLEGLWQTRRAPCRLDEPWRPHHQAAAGIRAHAASENAPFALIADEARRYYGLMFHPEVAHTPDGARSDPQFRPRGRGSEERLDDGRVPRRGARGIRARVGKGRVICGLSGGVDSAVAAVLIHEAIGDQLTCVFVDHGLLRAGEGEEVVRLFRGQFNIPLVHVQAGEAFLGALAGVAEPEAKRQDDRPAVHRDFRGRGEAHRRGRHAVPWNFSRRGRSIPT